MARELQRRIMGDLGLWSRVGSALWRWGPVAVWMGAIFFVSSLPTRPQTPGLQWLTWDDKLQHTLAYAFMSLLAWRALGSGRRRLGWNRAAAAILIAIGYAAFDECHQCFVPGRECAFSDWSCDAAGAAIAGVACVRITGRIPSSRASECTPCPR